MTASSPCKDIQINIVPASLPCKDIQINVAPAFSPCKGVTNQPQVSTWGILRFFFYYSTL